MQVAVEAGFQAGIGVDELVHQPVVARHDDHQVLTVILHGLQQRVDGLLAEVVFGLAVQGVGLVDKQYAAQRLFDHGAGLGGGLAHIARNQPGAVHFHQMALFEHAQALVDAGHQPGDHRLAGAWIAGEHHVQRHVHRLETVFTAQFVDGDGVDEVVDLALDALQADQLVELLLQVLDVLRGRLLLGGLLDVGGLGLCRRCGGLPGLRPVHGLFRWAGRGGLGPRNAPYVVRHAAEIVVDQRADQVHLGLYNLIAIIHACAPVG